MSKKYLNPALMHFGNYPGNTPKRSGIPDHSRIDFIQEGTGVTEDFSPMVGMWISLGNPSDLIPLLRQAYAKVKDDSVWPLMRSAWLARALYELRFNYCSLVKPYNSQTMFWTKVYLTGLEPSIWPVISVGVDVLIQFPGKLEWKPLCARSTLDEANQGIIEAKAMAALAGQNYEDLIY